ncbi:MAG: VOC family protein [Terriglobales bacterium]
MDAAVGQLLTLGATERSAPQDVGGGIRLAVVRTPSGSPVGLIYNPHFTLESP